MPAVTSARSRPRAGSELAILGVGVDGHIAYNMPGPMRLATHVTRLPDGLAASLAVPPERLAAARDHDGHRDHPRRAPDPRAGHRRVEGDGGAAPRPRARRSALAVLVPAHAPRPRRDRGPGGRRGPLTERRSPRSGAGDARARGPSRGRRARGRPPPRAAAARRPRPPRGAPSRSRSSPRRAAASSRSASSASTSPAAITMRRRAVAQLGVVGRRSTIRFS